MCFDATVWVLREYVSKKEPCKFRVRFLAWCFYESAVQGITWLTDSDSPYLFGHRLTHRLWLTVSVWALVDSQTLTHLIYVWALVDSDSDSHYQCLRVSWLRLWLTLLTTRNHLPQTLTHLIYVWALVDTDSDSPYQCLGINWLRLWLTLQMTSNQLTQTLIHLPDD